MSVTLNEAALRALLDAPESPVMRKVEEVANVAADALQERMNGIIDNPAVQGNVGVEMTPEGAVVGIANTGRIAEYLDHKLGALENWWLAVGEAAARDGS